MRNSLTRLFAETENPVFALDPGRVVVYCNSALARWLEVEPEQILGQRCSYHSRGAHEPQAAALAAVAAPPEAFLGATTAGIAQRTTSTGGSQRRAVRYSTLRYQDESWLLGVLDASDLADDAPIVESLESPAELHRRLQALRGQILRRYQFDRVLGDSPQARRIREQIRIAVESRARTLVVGPPGSGREHLARAIHGSGGAESGPRLLPLVCPLLDAELLEAAIDAFLRQEGIGTTRAAEATILLLDADLLPSETQETLLQLAQSVRRPFRTLATARVPLPQLAAEGTYRADLAAWLSPLVIELPPLAARRSDLPLLAQWALEEHNAAHPRQFSGFHPEALEALAAYSWPDNLDELVVLVAAACRQAAGPLIQRSDLPEILRQSAEPLRPERSDEPIELDRLLEDVEREMLRRALRRSKGNKAEAARWLRMPRARLLRRLEQLGLE